MNYFHFIWQNMVRNRRRTVLTVLSLALPLFVLATLMTVLTELNREPEGEDKHLRLVVRRARSLGDRLPEAYGAKLARVPGVRTVTTLTWFGGIYIDEANFFASFACDPDTLLPMYRRSGFRPNSLRRFRRSGRQPSPAGSSSNGSSGGSAIGSPSRERSIRSIWSLSCAGSTRGPTKPPFSSTGPIWRRRWAAPARSGPSGSRRPRQAISPGS